MSTSTDASTADRNTSDEPAPEQGIDASVEAILLSQDRPTTPEIIADAVSVVAPGCDVAAVREAVERLNGAYERTGRAFRIEAVAGGFRVMTLAEHASTVAAFQRSRGSSRLSRAALETLSIIAYRQPVTRAELEAIRGVACGEVLRGLIDRGMVMIKGRAEELGRPMLYGTTKRFLDVFGLASVKDLPGPDEPEQDAKRTD